jgi:putative restriction endonuclease
MDIQKRSSSGRGEYELAGSVGRVSTSSLIGRPLMIDTQSGLGQLSTGIWAQTQGGKPRLRMIEKGKGIHIHRQIEALLLMPQSIRAESQLLGGQPVVLAGRYILQRVDVTSAKLTGEAAVLQLGAIDCNNDSLTVQIDFRTRIQNIVRLYAQTDKLPPRVADALRAHQADVVAARRVSASTEKIVAEVIAATEAAARESDVVLIQGEDPVPLLLDLLRSQPTVEIPPVSEIDPADLVMRRRVADRWRIQKDRGPASTKFRTEVRNAYSSTCLFCGLRLVSDDVRVPGIDAAHIAAWAHYEADVVSNGLCLCKLHHWAFDQYLLAVTFDKIKGYAIIVTKLAYQAFKDDPTVLTSLEAVAGPIAVSRLPDDPDDWPRPQFLTQLYEDMGVDL